MDQTYHILKDLLRELGVMVPNSIIRHQLETPVGNTMRGISDALDSLNIENSVYQLPKEYLKELDYPYIMVLPNQKETFVVVTNDEERDAAIPGWDGVVLAAQKTEKTPIYKYLWFRNIIESIVNHQLFLIISISYVVYFLFFKPTFFFMSHAILSGLGLCISTQLLEKEYIGERHEKFCKIGTVIDCEKVLNSKGSKFFGVFKMSDMTFLFYTTLLLLFLIANDNWQGYSFTLLLIGCVFTLYSVIYQTIVIRKACLYCMSINLIVWLDTIIFILNNQTISLHKPFSFILSGYVAYILWLFVSRYLALTAQNTSLKSKVSALYNRDLFDWLLSKERSIDEVDDKYADVGGEDNGDVITMFVHPNCKNCKRVYQYIPELRKKTIVKTVSLASNDAELHEYCKRNKINKTPTIVFNGRELPDIYDIEDLKYVM